MNEIVDERIKRFIEIMDKEYRWEFTEEDAKDVIEVLDRIAKEILCE